MGQFKFIGNHQYVEVFEDLTLKQYQLVLDSIMFLNDHGYLSTKQIDLLIKTREVAEYFEEVMRLLCQTYGNYYWRYKKVIIDNE